MANTAPRRSEFSQNLIDTLRVNGGLFTVFAVALIIFGGFSIVNNPANWWFTPAAIGVFFIVIFLFMNARVVIKGAIAAGLALLFSGLAFKEGTLADPTGAGGLLWMALTLVAFFSCLSLSYMLASGASRWGTLIITQVLGFVTTYIIAYGFINVTVGTYAGFVLSMGAFVGLYRFGRRTYVAGAMPKTVATPAVVEHITEAAALASFESYVVKSRRGKFKGVLVWREAAYLLVPVELNSALGFIGRKLQRLSYEGKSINNWLLRLALQDAPLWRTRSAPILPVLLDLKNRNGKQARVMGASLPDTKKQLPVGIFPAKLFTSSDDAALEKAFRGFEAAFEEFALPLSAKQLEAVGDLGKK